MHQLRGVKPRGKIREPRKAYLGGRAKGQKGRAKGRAKDVWMISGKNLFFNDDMFEKKTKFSYSLPSSIKFLFPSLFPHRKEKEEERIGKWRFHMLRTRHIPTGQSLERFFLGVSPIARLMFCWSESLFDTVIQVIQPFWLIKRMSSILIPLLSHGHGQSP